MILDTLLFRTIAIRHNGTWRVVVESAVSQLTYVAESDNLAKALELATEEAGEEATYVLNLNEGIANVH